MASEESRTTKQPLSCSLLEAVAELRVGEMRRTLWSEADGHRTHSVSVRTGLTSGRSEGTITGLCGALVARTVTSLQAPTQSPSSPSSAYLLSACLNDTSYTSKSRQQPSCEASRSLEKLKTNVTRMPSSSRQVIANAFYGLSMRDTNTMNRPNPHGDYARFANSYGS